MPRIKRPPPDYAPTDEFTDLLYTTILDFHLSCKGGEEEDELRALQSLTKAHQVVKNHPSVLNSLIRVTQNDDIHPNTKGLKLLQRKKSMILPLDCVAILGLTAMLELFLNLCPESCDKSISERTYGLKYTTWPIHIHYAAEAGHIDCLRCLLEAKKELATVRVNPVGGNLPPLPLHYAVQGGHLECVKILLEAYEDGASSHDRNGNLPLHFAVQGGHLECVKILLEAYEDGASSQDINGNLPLHYANHVEIAQVLIDAYRDGLIVRNLNVEGRGRFNARRHLFENCGDTPIAQILRQENIEMLSCYMRQSGYVHLFREVESDQYLDAYGYTLTYED